MAAKATSSAAISRLQCEFAVSPHVSDASVAVPLRLCADETPATWAACCDNPEPGARPPLARLRGGWAALQPGPVAEPLLPLSGAGVRLQSGETFAGFWNSPDTTPCGVLCGREWRRLCAALREKSAVHGPECPISPVPKCLPERVSTLCHWDSRG